MRKRYPFSKHRVSMSVTSKHCKKCNEPIFRTRLGNWWCKKCNSRKELSEIR